MANWHSSVHALSNLLVEVAREYKKEHNRLIKKHPNMPGPSAQVLKEGLKGMLDRDLGDYFSQASRDKITEAVFHAVLNFEDKS